VSVPVSILCLFSCFCVYVYVIDILGETCAGASASLSMTLNSFIAATSAWTSGSSSSMEVLFVA
jgi:ketopantoate hydroxymethyltransferase